MVLNSATLNGHRVTRGRINLPAWGAWFADVSLDGETTIAGAAELKIADATYKGTILSGGPGKGRSEFRIVGGKGGWGKTIAKKSYANDAGVKLVTVVGDAANEAGETLDASSVDGAARVGIAFTRPRQSASRVLEQVAPSAWYVGEDGITRLGKRASKPYAEKATRITPPDRARAKVVLAAESLKVLVPGAVVDGIEAVDVVHEIAPKSGLRTTIYGKSGAGTTSRRLAALRLILDQLDPNRLFRGTYEYRVVTLGGKRVNLQPVLVSTGMPDLQRVPVRPGLSGSRSDLKLGSRVLVTWLNADPANPAVVGFEDAEGEGYKPVLTEIDAQTFVKLGAGIKPVAAAGDLAGGIWPIAPTQVKVLV